MKRYLLLLLIVLLPLASEARQQKERGFLFFRINRLDKDGRYHGRWKVYFGKDDVLIRNGRFRHGREVGTWKYYYPSGALYMKEKYCRRSDTMRVKVYHENGALAKEGQARMVRTPAMDQYFWTGEWEVFDANGVFSHIEVYEKGNLVSRKQRAATD